MTRFDAETAVGRPIGPAARTRCPGVPSATTSRGQAMPDSIRQAYAHRAGEYVSALGSVRDMDEQDVALIGRWGRGVKWQVLDVGSGPGHWTEFLRARGVKIRGIDLVPEFVRSAHARFPQAEFDLGDARCLPVRDFELGGLLSWYSLIHSPPARSSTHLEEFARALRPTGSLLVGAFMGPHAEAFEHAISEAFYWSADGLCDALSATGFRVMEVHTRSVIGRRSHLAVLAERR